MADIQEEAGQLGLVALFVLQPFGVFYPGETAGFKPEKADGLIAQGLAVRWENRAKVAEAKVADEPAKTGLKGAEEPAKGLSLTALLKK